MDSLWKPATMAHAVRPGMRLAETIAVAYGGSPDIPSGKPMSKAFGRASAQREAFIASAQIPGRDALAEETARLLAVLRARRPLVQAVTNFVSMDVAANALLAIGASPAMSHAPEEAEDFGAIASALVVNIGTLSQDWVVGMEAAAEVAGRLGRPWVLDPVGVGATRYRDETTRRRHCQGK